MHPYLGPYSTRERNKESERPPYTLTRILSRLEKPATFESYLDYLQINCVHCICIIGDHDVCRRSPRPPGTRPTSRRPPAAAAALSVPPFPFPFPPLPSTSPSSTASYHMHDTLYHPMIPRDYSIHDPTSSFLHMIPLSVTTLPPPHTPPHLSPPPVHRDLYLRTRPSRVRSKATPTDTVTSSSFCTGTTSRKLIC